MDYTLKAETLKKLKETARTETRIDDRITKVETQINDLHGKRISNLGQSIDKNDAVTRGELIDAHIGLESKIEALQSKILDLEKRVKALE